VRRAERNDERNYFDGNWLGTFQTQKKNAGLKQQVLNLEGTDPEDQNKEYTLGRNKHKLRSGRLGFGGKQIGSTCSKNRASSIL